MFCFFISLNHRWSLLVQNVAQIPVAGTSVWSTLLFIGSISHRIQSVNRWFWRQAFLLIGDSRRTSQFLQASNKLFLYNAVYNSSCTPQLPETPNNRHFAEARATL